MPDTPIPLTNDDRAEQLEDCIALCLSGGGYRAMLFHLGTLWYLNDAGWLPKLGRISTVSGGSITAGVLATRWNELTFDASGKSPQFAEKIVGPIRKMAGTTIDAGSILSGLLPGTSISERVIKKYKQLLFGEKTLQDFPDSPRFVINATNVQTGALFRFSKRHIADYQLGIILNPKRLVAEAVAASSAFPPVLSPCRLEFAAGEFQQGPGKTPFTTKVVLTDGGVYDNIGIETAWKRCKTVLVSDAGSKLQPDAAPSSDWVRHSVRINSLIDNQVRSLRKRQVVSSFKAGERKGSYWGMRTQPSKYPAQSALAVSDARALRLAETPTRLAELPAILQSQLINFGYAMAERAMRSHVDPQAFRPTAFPCPGGVG